MTFSLKYLVLICLSETSSAILYWLVSLNLKNDLRFARLSWACFKLYQNMYLFQVGCECWSFLCTFICCPLSVVIFFGALKLADVLTQLFELVKSWYYTIWILGHLLVEVTIYYLSFSLHSPLDNGRVQFTPINVYMQVYPEGTHFMIPWFERPIIYDVRARPNLVESTSGSRDLQMVSICITSVRFSQPTILHDLEPVFSC